MNKEQLMERINAIKAKIKASETKIDNSIAKVQAIGEDFETWKATLAQKSNAK